MFPENDDYFTLPVFKKNGIRKPLCHHGKKATGGGDFGAAHDAIEKELGELRKELGVIYKRKPVGGLADYHALDTDDARLERLETILIPHAYRNLLLSDLQLPINNRGHRKEIDVWNRKYPDDRIGE